jgi:hypothetical protein
MNIKIDINMDTYSTWADKDTDTDMDRDMDAVMDKETDMDMNMDMDIDMTRTRTPGMDMDTAHGRKTRAFDEQNYSASDFLGRGVNLSLVKLFPEKTPVKKFFENLKLLYLQVDIYCKMPCMLRK